MSRTPYHLGDLGGRLTWRMLLDFVAHIPFDSALYRELHPDDSETIEWATGHVDSALLANIADAMTALCYSYSCVHSKHHPPKPTMIKRPWADEEGIKRIGRDPIPISEMNQWLSEQFGIDLENNK